MYLIFFLLKEKHYAIINGIRENMEFAQMGIFFFITLVKKLIFSQPFEIVNILLLMDLQINSLKKLKNFLDLLKL